MPIGFPSLDPIQQTILRLLTNRTVMGDDARMPDEAWLAWEKLIPDERAAFLPLSSLPLLLPE